MLGLVAVASLTLSSGMPMDLQFTESSSIPQFHQPVISRPIDNNIFPQYSYSMNEYIDYVVTKENVNGIELDEIIGDIELKPFYKTSRKMKMKIKNIQAIEMKVSMD